MSGYQKLPSEEQPDFAEKRLDDNKDEQQQRQQPSYQGAYVRAGMVTAVSLIVLCALSILCAGGFNHPALVHPTAFEKAARLERLQSDARQAARGLIKRNSLVQEAPESASPTFSSLTTTDQQGEPTTQSFVYTTRPIVNPGGYTIGTMTGYVQIKPTATASATNSSSPEQPTSAGAGTTPQRLPGAYVIAAAKAAAEAADTEGSSPPVGARLAKRDAGVVGAAAAPSTTEPPTALPVTTTGTGSAEYSTSTDRAGSVYTLVKTTRPIVNPGGYTIGTLDGAWVDVAKQTQSASSANRDKRNAAAVVQHEELRRRNVADLHA
ncbi:hypothetical protein BMF94_4102 [Rhodotorula taiwanensis]|uniref:Uncharacterized protein n=1 Tax=Rhodotorula taiwanensis TaxID=741276 RepID=A0A2S5B7V9_9BASI|nr:hypothetical protein BMF94_4102 [Rhodotorula taiwanensis]